MIDYVPYSLYDSHQYPSIFRLNVDIVTHCHDPIAHTFSDVLSPSLAMKSIATSLSKRCWFLGEAIVVFVIIYRGFGCRHVARYQGRLKVGLSEGKRGLLVEAG